MKKFIFPGLVLLYLLSFFVPYLREVSPETFQLEALSGFQVMGKNPIAFGLLGLLFIAYQLIKKRQFIVGVGLSWLFLGQSLFVYSLYFSALVNIGWGDFFPSLSSLLTQSLTAGYYLTSLLGLVIAGIMLREPFRTAPFAP